MASVVEVATPGLQHVLRAGVVNIKMNGIANVSRVRVPLGVYQLLRYRNLAGCANLCILIVASAGGTTLTTKVSTSTTTKSTTTASKTTTTSLNTGSTGFPTTNGLQFEIDGKTSYFAGSNSYWIGFLTNNDDVDLVFDHMDEAGLRILRVWGFNDVNSVPSAGTVYYQLLQDGTATINTGADGLQRLDYVVASAEAHNVKLIINFVNNWSDYGGMAAYVTAFGGSQTSWYTNTAAQTAYQAYVKAVVSRYKDSPAVFAWELANEPRCNGCDTSILYNWIKTTSAYIKSLDSKHMVAIGDGMNILLPFLQLSVPDDAL